MTCSSERTVFELAGYREHRQASNVEDRRCFLPASGTPISSRALTEWCPIFGESWQVPQKPGMVSILRSSEAGNACDVHPGVVEQFFAARHRTADARSPCRAHDLVPPVVGDVDGLEEFRGVGNGHTEVAIVVAMAGIKPGR